MMSRREFQRFSIKFANIAADKAGIPRLSGAEVEEAYRHYVALEERDAEIVVKAQRELANG